jgi:hypothetical protein
MCINAHIKAPSHCPGDNRSLLSFCVHFSSFLFIFIMSVVSEPAAPSMRTAVPGPATHKTKEELDAVIDARTVQMVIDYEKSIGN